MLNSYRLKFRELFGDIEIVSTVDHPYSSPPIRIFSSHYLLYEFQKIGRKSLLISWDSIKPPKGRIYRSSMGLDIGILATHNSDLLFYNTDLIYPKQQPKKIDFEKLDNYFEAIINAFYDENLKDYRMTLRDNFKALISGYKKVLSESETSHHFYKNTLSWFYSYFDLHFLSDFIQGNMISLYGSEEVRKWMIWGLQQLNREEPKYGNFLGDNNFFSHRLFRTLDDKNIEYNYFFEENILEGIQTGQVLFSHELFFYFLALANVKHFGNDRGFFERLSKNPHFKNVKNLQITKHNQDSYPLVELLTANTFEVLEVNNHFKIKRIKKVFKDDSKTMTMLFVHIRNKELFKNILLEKGSAKPISLDVGDFY